jgi:hypothetical protein
MSPPEHRAKRGIYLAPFDELVLSRVNHCDLRDL